MIVLKLFKKIIFLFKICIIAVCCVYTCDHHETQDVDRIRNIISMVNNCMNPVDSNYKVTLHHCVSEKLPSFRCVQNLDMAS